MATDTLVFVSCADSGELHVLRLASDSGQLRTEQVLALGGQLMPMALSPNGTRLYVARRSDPLAVVTLAVDARAGRAEVLSEAALPASMAHLATDNTGRWLLSASYGADLVAVQAIAADGVVAAGRGATTYATGRHAHSALASPGNRFVLLPIRRRHGRAATHRPCGVRPASRHRSPAPALQRAGRPHLSAG